MNYYCYLVECANGAYYTGWTVDPARRLKQHNAGKGARYTRLYGPVRLVYVEAVPDRKAALKRELAIAGSQHLFHFLFFHYIAEAYFSFNIYFIRLGSCNW